MLPYSCYRSNCKCHPAWLLPVNDSNFMERSQFALVSCLTFSKTSQQPLFNSLNDYIVWWVSHSYLLPEVTIVLSCDTTKMNWNCMGEYKGNINYFAASYCLYFCTSLFCKPLSIYETKNEIGARVVYFPSFSPSSSLFPLFFPLYSPGQRRLRPSLLLFRLGRKLFCSVHKGEKRGGGRNQKWRCRWFVPHSQPPTITAWKFN